MPYNVGEVLEGKAASITKFGVFVTLPDGSTGLVHISEVANTFVNNIRDHVSDGDTVKVKVISIGDDGRINLSIKKALPAPQTPERRPAPRSTAPTPSHRAPAPKAPESFEDKLSRFMKESNSNLSGRFEKRSRRRGGRD